MALISTPPAPEIVANLKQAMPRPSPAIILPCGWSVPGTEHACRQLSLVGGGHTDDRHQHTGGTNVCQACLFDVPRIVSDSEVTHMAGELP